MKKIMGCLLIIFNLTAVHAEPLQFIIRFKQPYVHQSRAQLQQDLDSLHMGLKIIKPMVFDAYIVQIDALITGPARANILYVLKSQPMIDFAEEDLMVKAPHATYTSLLQQQWRSAQWDMLDSSPYSVNADWQAWHEAPVAPNLYVGVLDSGSCVNPSLTFIGGYDFSPGAIDPENPLTKNGDYHGCLVSGVVAAHDVPDQDLKGIAPGVKLVPLNVFGQSDTARISAITNAIEWAIGHSVPGIPNNPHPVKVIQMSLGTGTEGGIHQDCPLSVQAAMHDAYHNNVMIAVSAGNEDQPVEKRIFARCDYIIATASTSKDGIRSSFSNYGLHIFIAAPGEQIPTTGPDSYLTADGTSLAAPHVSGTIVLMLSINPDLTSEQILAILRKTAKPFATTPDKVIGAGIVDTLNAVKCVKTNNSCLRNST